ncbi:MAG TPA: dTDP-4-dehydrorhamnose 3,5-epimerase family protein [Polyangia bacterium]|nr:dTDP-4-dehydrorhamnose 3,5-epimerase family protein [Polyangia bacterium]
MSLRFTETGIEGVVQIGLDPIRDDRGYFARAWSADEFLAGGLNATWVQANLGHNPVEGTLRGMHLQLEPHAETKLVRCTRGRIQDVAVDLRPTSTTFRRWVSVELTAERGEMLYIPPGCAHGYLTLEPESDLFYFTSEAYDRASATGVRYEDPAFGIRWEAPIRIVSEADRTWPLQDAVNEP